MRELKGILTAIVTPFDEQGELNLEALAPFLEFQRSAGIDGVVVAGTNGEGISLSVKERKRLLEAVLRERGDLLVIAGTGAASITDAVELTRHAGDCGADAALVLPPFFFKQPSAAGIAAYYRQALDAASLPVLLYSIPQFSAVPITDEVLGLLDGHPRLAGVKDSAGGWERTRQLITEHSGLRIFPGSDPLLARSLAAGAAGAITGITNALPELMVNVYRAHIAGQDTGSGQARIDAAHAIMADYPPIAVSKSLLVARGLPRMHVRPPLIDLSADQERELVSRMREAGLI